MALRAGDLRESVAIQSPTESTNSYGESTISWSSIANRRASIRNMQIAEVMSTQEPYTVATHEVEFRYVPELKASMRLIWNSRTPPRTLDIISISEQNNRESQRVVCKEQVS